MGVIYYSGEDFKIAGELTDYTFDSDSWLHDNGSRTFTLQTSADMYSALRGGYIFCPDSPEHGGRVEAISVDSVGETITATGDTWLGMLSNFWYTGDQPPEDCVTVGDRIAWLISSGSPAPGMDLTPWMETVPDDTPSTDALNGPATYLDVLIQITGGAILIDYSHTGKLVVSGRPYKTHELDNGVYFVLNKAVEVPKYQSFTAPVPLGYSYCRVQCIAPGKSDKYVTAVLNPDGSIVSGAVAQIYAYSDEDRRQLLIETDTNMITTDSEIAQARREAESALVGAADNSNSLEVIVRHPYTVMCVGDSIHAYDTLTGAEATTAVASKHFHGTPGGFSLEYTTRKIIKTPGVVS